MDLELKRLTSVETLLDADLLLPDAAPEGDAGPLSEDGIHLERPFHLSGSARRVGAVVVVAGTVTGEAELDCDRCLERVPLTIRLEFESRWLEGPDAGRGAAARRRPASEEAEEADATPLPPGASTLSLTEIVRERVLLEIPYRRLCKPDCKGLCARCGCNLNAGGCSCTTEPTASQGPLGTLAELRRRPESR